MKDSSIVGSLPLLTDGESSAIVLRVFEFINHRYGKIFHGDVALAIRVNKQPIVA
jgi:hypothetical protein